MKSWVAVGRETELLGTLTFSNGVERTHALGNNKGKRIARFRKGWAVDRVYTDLIVFIQGF